MGQKAHVGSLCIWQPGSWRQESMSASWAWRVAYQRFASWEWMWELISALRSDAMTMGGDDGGRAGGTHGGGETEAANVVASVESAAEAMATTATATAARAAVRAACWPQAERLAASLIWPQKAAALDLSRVT